MHDLLCHTGIAYATMLEFVQCINQQFGDFAKEMNLKTNIMYLKAKNSQFFWREMGRDDEAVDHKMDL